MNRIFISYKRQDKQIVFPIVEEIKQHTGVDCWIDVEGIESGDQFQNVIIDAIDNSGIVIFMLSKNFIAPYVDETSGEVNLKKQTFPEKEVMYALRHGKRLVPISIDGTSVYDCKWLEFNCSGLDYVDWNDVSQRDKLMNNLRQWEGITESDIIVKSYRSGTTVICESHPGYACININVDESCNIFRFGKKIGTIEKEDWGELCLRQGKHELTFVSINNKKVTKIIDIPSVDYTDFIHIRFGEEGGALKEEGSNETPSNKPRSIKHRGCVVIITVAFVLLVLVLPLGIFSLNGDNNMASSKMLPSSQEPIQNNEEYIQPNMACAKAAQKTQSVDLGLPSGTLWANQNIGAIYYADYGELYSWGELETKEDYRQSCYKEINERNIIGTKYDVATRKLGQEWQMPSQEQFDELIRECLWKWEDRGFHIIGKNGNSIFLPASGWSCSYVVEHRNSYGYYWTGDKANSLFGKGLIFSKSEYKTGNGYLYYGLAVRAVKNNTK